MNFPASNGRARPPGAPDQRETDEFATGSSEWPDDLSRRNFLRLAGATLALGGLNSCTNSRWKKLFRTLSSRRS